MGCDCDFSTKSARRDACSEIICTVNNIYRQDYLINYLCVSKCFKCVKFYTFLTTFLYINNPFHDLHVQNNFFAQRQEAVKVKYIYRVKMLSKCTKLIHS